MLVSFLLILSTLSSVGFNLLIQHGSQKINAFVFAIGMTIGAVGVRLAGLGLFWPGIEAFQLSLWEILFAFGAGITVAIGDLFFYLLLARGVRISRALPTVFITKILIVAVGDAMVFGAELGPVQWIGVCLGLLSIYFLTRYSGEAQKIRRKLIGSDSTPVR